MRTYKGWSLLEAMPKGWVLDKAGSPLAGYAFVTNGKSVLHGQKRALLLVKERQAILFAPEMSAPSAAPPEGTQPEKTRRAPAGPEVARTVNELARARFKQKLLGDILVDLTICEIEGWCKREYICDLRGLLNGIAIDAAFVPPNGQVKAAGRRPVAP